MKRAWRLRPRHHFSLDVCMLLFVPALAAAQAASLRGQVVDQSGAVIPKATVILTGPAWNREYNDYGRKWLLLRWRFGARPVRGGSETGAKAGPNCSQAGHANSAA
jgi:hypothetical protein